MVRRQRKYCAIYTVLWTLYSLQEGLGLSSLGQPLLFLLIAYSLYKVVYVIGTYPLPPMMKALTWLLLMFTLYGVIYMVGDTRYTVYEFHNSFNIPPFYYLKYIYCSIPVVYVYYDYAHKGVFNQSNLPKYIGFFIITSIFSFFSFYSTKMNGSGSFEYVDGITNNNGYKFVAIIPLILLSLKNRWKWLNICICIIFPFLSLKRGAILIACIGLFIICKFIFKHSDKSKKIRIILGAFLFFVLVGQTIINYISESKGFQRRIEQTLNGNTSGRDVLATRLWTHINNETDDLNLLFGNGADSTVGIAGNYAHNDWLELLTNQGILGVASFAIFFIAWFHDWRKIRKRSSLECSYSFGFGLIYFFLCSIFSMAYTAFAPPIAIAIGICLAQYYQRKYITTHAQV